MSGDNPGNFSKMSRAEAKEYLSHFLWEVNEGLEAMTPEIARSGAVADYSLESIPEIFKWAVENKLKTVPIEPNLSLSDWIRNSDLYQENLFEFDADSKIIVNRICYYFGECFVQTYPGKLSWSVGKRSDVKNMPIISGFMFSADLAPQIIAHNLLRGLMIKVDYSRVASVITSWCDSVPR